MLGLYAMKDDVGEGVSPFSVVALHGMVRDERGRKMSKSRGNMVDPMAWIDQYGADALRFTLARGANPGSDLATSVEWVAGSRNFCSKLFNATRFALMNGARVPTTPLDRWSLGDVDQWILDRLDEVVVATTALLEDFQIAKAAEGLYHFVWDEFCDWYLEFAKVAIYGDPADAEQTRQVLGTVLDTVLRLLHPFIPFVTERLWTTLTGGESLVIADWPTGAGADTDTDTATATSADPATATGPAGGAGHGAGARIALVQHLVTEVRRFRADQGLRPSAKVPATLTGLEEAGLGRLEPVVRSVARLAEPGADFTASVSVSVGLGSESAHIELDTSGTVDVGAEIARLRKDLAVATKEITDTTAKLDNAAFVAKAPAAVVEKISARLARAQTDVERITSRLAVLDGTS